MELNKNSYKPYEEKMETSISVLRDNFNKVRAGRANPALLEGITVDYYGVDSPLQQVANVQVPEARMITITPWEATMLQKIEKAIHAANIGINPINDGKCIRLTFPKLSEEDRVGLTKEINQLGEEAKISIRNVRREAIDAFKQAEKASDISEDDYYTAEKKIQELTDDFIDKVDQAVTKKNAELMEV